MWTSIINILIGIWVMLAPGIFEFNRSEANFNYILGPLVISFAITAIWEVNRSARFFTLLAGIILSVLPFLSSYSTGVIINNLICGIIIVSLSLVRGKIKTNYGGGWISLFQKNPEHWQRSKNM